MRNVADRKGKYRVLYFINAAAPTNSEIADAEQYGPACFFRNARFVNDGEAVEDCEAVAGAVPPAYAARYPAAVTLADFYAGRLPDTPMGRRAIAAAPGADQGSGAMVAPAGDPFLSLPAPGTMARRFGGQGEAVDWNKQG